MMIDVEFGASRGLCAVLRRGDDGLLEHLFGLQRSARPPAATDGAVRELRRPPAGAPGAPPGPGARSWSGRRRVPPAARRRATDLRLLRLEQHRLLLANALLEVRDHRETSSRSFGSPSRYFW